MSSKPVPAKAGGRDWADFLCENNIPFAIRLRGDLRITTEDGHELTLQARLHWRQRGKHFTGWLGTGFDQIRHLLRSDPLEAIAPWLRIAPKHIKISRVG